MIGSVLMCSCASVKRLFTIDNSYFEPGQADSLYHPHGILEEHTYRCSPPSGTSQRKMFVYLPRGYYESEKRYPVQYLIHGARGNETSWIKDGNMIQEIAHKAMRDRVYYDEKTKEHSCKITELCI